MTKLILSLIVVSILVLSSLSNAGDEVDLGNLMTPRSSSQSYSSPSYVIPTTPGVSFSYSSNQYQGMSVTSSDGHITTFFPALQPVNGVKIITCVNAGIVSYCY